MYKVVIIDDEPIIIEGLSRVVPWDIYHCKIVGTAGNGHDGLKVIRESRPDMIFSDISMPGMDGLTMIAALKVEFPDMLITILTGYRDFDFAQKAIRLGVSRFLLKPSNMNEIEEALSFMTECLKTRSDKDVRVHTAERAANDVADAKTETAAASAGEESTAGSFLVKNALRYMKGHYRERMTLAEVSEKIYVSQWHLSKLLNRHTGKSFSELLNRIRIEAAKELLKDPSMRIGDVSEKVGFLDVAHFSRVFKKQEGISANEYRNSRI